MWCASLRILLTVNQHGNQPSAADSEIHADKDVENSKWNTPLRETITIHASGNLAADAELPQGK